MTCLPQDKIRRSRADGRKMGGRFLALVWFVFIGCLAHGQTFTVLHSFAGTDGAQPNAGVTMDAAGNLYGTTLYGGILNCDEGGILGCGVVYKLTHVHSNWNVSVLYKFPQQIVGPGDITIGPNGLPYGTQILGYAGSGAVFELLPSPTVSTSVDRPWLFHLVHAFGSGDDGGVPSQIVFDPAGKIFGAALAGGTAGDGVVHELTPSTGGWTETILYNFLGGTDGSEPRSIALDEAGNIYGTTGSGGNQDCYQNMGCGTIYKLSPSGSGWTKTILHVFEKATDGSLPGPVARDGAGNLFGLTATGAPGNGGTIWELSPSNGSWVFTVLYTFPGPTEGNFAPFRPVLDSTGALYGVNNGGGSFNFGRVYKLAPSEGGWIFTDLYDFSGQQDGCYPVGPVALDAAGDIYGATQMCGQFSSGNVFEVTP